MIFGQTTEQINADNVKKNLHKIFGVRKFAFFPVMLEDGRYLWLEYYYQSLPFCYNHSTLKVDEIYNISINHRCRDYYDWNITKEQKLIMDRLKETYDLP